MESTAAAEDPSSETATPQKADKVQWRSEVEIPTANDALQAAAARLKALASGASAATAAGSRAESPEAGSSDSGKAVKKLKLGSAASKLAALRGGPPPEKEESREKEDVPVESVT